MNSVITTRYSNSKIRLVFVGVVVCVALAASVTSAVAQNGVLKVTSFPAGASVTVDGVDTGKVTPMSVVLPVGNHTVVVSLPNSGWRPDSRPLDIVSGNNDLSVTLLPMLTVGPQGPKGDKGDTGAQGIQGIQGLKGDTGAQGIQGIQGLKGDQGDTGAQGLQGIQGLQGLEGLTGLKGDKGDTGDTGPQGPAGPSGFRGMQEFRNLQNAPFLVTAWTAPAGVTKVLVEMWGAGGGGDSVGGGGGAYARSVVSVTPGAVYLITVGGGGISAAPFQHAATSGASSTMTLGGGTLIFAGGGDPANGFILGEGGDPDNSAAISRRGGGGNTGGAEAANASLCPNGPGTGHGGGQFGGGNAGYVLLTW